MIYKILGAIAYVTISMGLIDLTPDNLWFDLFLNAAGATLLIYYFKLWEK